MYHLNAQANKNIYDWEEDNEEVLIIDDIDM